jgi:CO/xanthine dehydrogenase FAD-binding subunit
MILSYQRPATIQEALILLNRPEIPSRPMGGGTILNRPGQDDFEVVDLQALGLDRIEQKGSRLQIGACVTLQSFLEYAQQFLKSSEAGSQAAGPWQALVDVTRREAPINIRQVATVAGTLVASTGRSGFTAAMMALDADLGLNAISEIEIGITESSSVEVPVTFEAMGIGSLLPLRSDLLLRRLITEINIPLNVRLGYAAVSRTPADFPLIMAATATWPSGRRRVVVGGFGPAPALVFDGMESNGADIAARSACLASGDDWASAEYRMEMAGILVRRLL